MPYSSHTHFFSCRMPCFHWCLPAFSQQCPPSLSPSQSFECGAQVLLGFPRLLCYAEALFNSTPPTESLPAPWLSMTPVSWVTPGLKTTAVCRGGLRGVTFLLRREGDHEFLEVPEAQEDVEATFPVHQPGNYSCSYRTDGEGALSEPSATVTIEELGDCGNHLWGLLGEEDTGGMTTFILTSMLNALAQDQVQEAGHTVAWV